MTSGAHAGHAGAWAVRVAASVAMTAFLVADWIANGVKSTVTMQRIGETKRYSDENGDPFHLAPGENTGGWRGDGRCTSFG
jgi:hypothetical protein